MNPLNQLITLLQALNPFALLGIAIACEIVGTSALRVSAGFTRFWPSLAVVVCYLLSFFLYAQVLQRIPMGVAYAIWAGVGTAGVVMIGMLVWRDQITPWQFLGMALVVIGAVILNAFTPTAG